MPTLITPKAFNIKARVAAQPRTLGVNSGLTHKPQRGFTIATLIGAVMLNPVGVQGTLFNIAPGCAAERRPLATE